MGIIEHNCRLGVLAFGDSITNGGGELQWGVALQSWALWVARGLGLPYSGYAIDGASAGHVVDTQIPAHAEGGPGPGARYELGCLYIGTNDVRALDWDPAAFERDFARAMWYLAERCDQLLAVTVPLDLGRPRAGARVSQCNRIIEGVADDAGGLVLDLSALRARNLLMADRVHPTAFGQIAIAERALDVLGPAGLLAVVRPSSLITYRTTRIGRLRGDLTYTWRSAKTVVDARWKAWLGARHTG